VKRDGLCRLGVGLHNHRGPEGENLSHRAAHVRCVKANGDDRVCSEALGMIGESLEGLVAHLFEKLRVHLDLPATPSPEKGPYVLPQSPGPYD